MWSCVCFTGFDQAGESWNKNETHFSSNRVRARHAGDQNVVDMMKVKKFHNPKLYQHVDQTRVWHLYGFWYKRISEYIRVKKMTEMNIRIYSYEICWHERISEYICMKFFDTNEYPKIFISKFWYEWISKWIFGSKIFQYLNIFITLWTKLAPDLCFYNLNSFFWSLLSTKYP